ncbi:MAG: cytochrome c nitrite reductase small subunit [Actinomycetota bacterium]|nr:cytochrome c nitrite reductase small subunit [Actinomycetota bacterium]
MERLLKFFTPPPGWQLPVIIALGIFIGVGLLVVHLSRAASYMGDSPETCINCHVMYPQYASWKHSSHREVATCSDCHVPHDNLVKKYLFKASDGARHAAIFTARLEPQVIRIKPAGITAVQNNCVRCHQDLVEMTQLIEVTGHNHEHGTGKRCWDCHREVPHGTVRSLSSSPFSLVPRLPSPMPGWLNTFIEKKNE